MGSGGRRHTQRHTHICTTTTLTHRHTHIHTHTCMHARKYARTHTHNYAHIFIHAHTHTCHCTQGVHGSVGHNVVVIIVVKLTVDIILELRISIVPWFGDMAVVGGAGVLLLDDVESEHGLPLAVSNCRADAF